MEIQYTKHAEIVLAERGIAKAAIEKLLNQPQRVIKGEGKEEIIQGIFEHGDEELLLRSICVKEQGIYKVITAYWTSKIDKYWEGKR